MRFKLTIALLLLPCLMYAQYLELNDIAIFIKSKDLISEIIGKHIDIFGRDVDSDEEWENYNSMQKRFYQIMVFENISSLDEIYYEEKYKQMEETFIEFINCPVPNELGETFELIGWEENGNQKFWTSVANSRMAEEAAKYGSTETAAGVTQSNAGFMGQIGSGVVSRAMNIQPTLILHSGEKINIMLNKNLYLPPVENNPVTRKYVR